MPAADVDTGREIVAPDEEEEDLTVVDLGGNCDVDIGMHCAFAGDDMCIVQNCEFECTTHSSEMFVAHCPSCAKLKKQHCDLTLCCPACQDGTDELAQCKLDQGTSNECSFEEIAAC